MARRIGEHLVGAGYPPLLLTPRVLPHDCAPYQVVQVGSEALSSMCVWPMGADPSKERSRYISLPWVLDARGYALEAIEIEWRTAWRSGCSIAFVWLEWQRLRDAQWQRALAQWEALPMVQVEHEMELGIVSAMEVPLIRIGENLSDIVLSQWRGRLQPMSAMCQHLVLALDASVREGESLQHMTWRSVVSEEGLSFRSRAWVQHCAIRCSASPGHVVRREELILPPQPFKMEEKTLTRGGELELHDHTYSCLIPG